MAKSDYYQILGIDEKASSAEIKKAYRRLAKECHPDTHPGDSQAERKFKEVSEAYSVLSSPKRRQQYDQMRRFGFSGAGVGGGGFQTPGFDFDLGDLFTQGAQTGPRAGRSRRRTSLNLDDLFDFGGLGDLFGQMFDRENGFGQGPKNGRAADIHATLEVPFQTAALGGKATFSINKEQKCGSCRGTGSKGGKSPKKCAECHGSGMISKSQGMFAVNRPCPRCLGRGNIIKDVCPTCKGAGRVNAQKKYAINIKPGTPSGHKIRLRGEGNQTGTSATPGDLFVTIKVAKHRFFTTKGLDVFCEIPLDPKRMQKGTKVRVRTINGNTVELRIPPDTKRGKTLRLKGMGIKSGKVAGDQFVKIVQG